MSYDDLLNPMPFVFEKNNEWEPKLQLPWTQVQYIQTKGGWEHTDRYLKKEVDGKEEPVFKDAKEEEKGKLVFNCGKKAEILVVENDEYTPVRAMLRITNNKTELQVYHITCNSEAAEVLMIDSSFGIIEPTKKKNIVIYYRNDLSDLRHLCYIMVKNRKLPYKYCKNYENVKGHPETLEPFLKKLRGVMFPDENKKKGLDISGGYKAHNPDGMERIELCFKYDDGKTLKKIEEEENAWLGWENKQ